MEQTEPYKYVNAFNNRQPPCSPW